ncbi:MAG: adenylate/guanylate cyclase domain-containing protein, partial [Syntrophothermus sp.]
MSDPSPRPTPALPGTQPTEQGATGTSVGQSGQGLPSGTVTFLFTDIEGSTRLAQQFPEDLPALLARHNEIMDRAIETHRGFVFRTAGDSYSVAFHNAKDALEAALDSQKALQAEAWSPAAIQVRMGIHTGTAQLRPEASDPYSGYATLALTQRIMSAGHGGQVLLSQTVHDLIKDQLPIQARLRDMGECRLKDLLQPHRLYQLECPGLRSEFSPLNTIENTLHNLPTQLTSFIGRENEMRDIKRLIAGNRMVTLTGSGGCGKTRLSIQVASEIQSDFRHGVWLVELAALADPALVAQVITTTLKLREDN